MHGDHDYLGFVSPIHCGDAYLIKVQYLRSDHLGVLSVIAEGEHASKEDGPHFFTGDRS